MIPVAFFLVKDKPSDVGQLPDGSATVDDMAHQRKTFKVFKNEHSLPFAKAVRTPAFWLISLAATGGFAAYSFASSQGVIHFTTIGLDRALIVAGVSVMGGAGLVGKVVIGIAFRPHRAGAPGERFGVPHRRRARWWRPWPRTRP